MHAPRIGLYTLDAPIGRGGMGVVWRATHRPSGLPVAIKLWTGMGTAAHRYRAALSRELRAIAALDHAHVIVVHDAGYVTADEAARCESTPGALFVVTELADTDLARDRPNAWSDVRRVLLAILDGLAHAHARGIVHRDLKPENVLRVGAAWKLADFGIATVAGEDPATMPRIAGTPAYMAPEALVGNVGALGPWTDLYSLGCLAWELVSGAPPFVGSHVEVVIARHLQRDLPPLVAGGAVPPGLDAWLARLLVEDPRSRFRLAADARHALVALGDTREAWAEARRHTLSVSTTWLNPAAVPAAVPMAATLPPAYGDSASPIQVPPLSPMPADAEVEPVPRHGAALALVGLRTPRMIGRTVEREALWAALGAVHASARAQVAVVVGPAGSGRTRLLQWLGECAHEVGAARVVWRVAGRLDALPDEGGIAGDRPLLVVVDDADTDPAGLAFAEHVLRMRPIADLPVLVVCALRRESVAEPVLAAQVTALIAAGADAARRIDLDAMSVPSMEALVHQVLRLDDALGLDLVRRSEGNPGFAAGTVAEWARRGVIVAERGRYRLAPGASAAVPDTLEHLGTGRTDDVLSGARDDDRRATALLAAIEDRVPVARWMALCAAMGVVPSPGWLDQLLAADVVRADDRGLSPASPAIRAHLVAESRARGEWRAMHAAIAAVLAAESAPDALALGRHRIESGDDAGALAPLATLHQRAVPDALRRVLLALELRAGALARLGLPEESKPCVAQAVMVAAAALERGDIAAARAAGQHALVVARRAGDLVAIADVSGTLATAARLEGRQALIPMGEAMEAVRAGGATFPTGIAGVVRSGWILALQQANRHLDALSLVSDWLASVEGVRRPTLLRVRASIHRDLAELDAAWADTDEAMALDMAAARFAGVGFTHSQRGEVAYERGDFEAAAAEHTLGLEMHRRVGNLYGIRNDLLCLARARALCGRPDPAGFGVATALSRALGASLDEVRWFEAEVALHLGHMDAARATLRPACDALPQDARTGMKFGLFALLCEAEAHYVERWRPAFATVRQIAEDGPIATPSATAAIARSGVTLQAEGCVTEAAEVRVLVARLGRSRL